MKKRTKIILISSILIILVVVIILGIYIYTVYEPTSMLKIGGYYDSNGNLIKGVTESMIGGVEGVKYITLIITVENKDTVPLTLSVANITPTSINSVKPTTKLTVGSKAKANWVTGLIDVESYEGKTQSFCVAVVADKIPALRESSSVNGCISIKVDPNPIANFGITVNSTIGDGAINPSCSENWTCSAWSTCSSGTQTRTCTDSNSCGTTVSKPLTSQSCAQAVKFRTIDLSYSSGAAVAYTQTCGTTLTAFGKTTGACTEYDCSATNQNLNVPAQSGTLKFWYRDVENVCICDVGKTSGYPMRYSTTDSDATKVSVSPSSIDSTMEVVC